MNLDRIIIDEEDVDGVALIEKVFRLFDEIFGKDDIFERLRVHEVVAHVVDVTELETLCVCRKNIDRFGGANLLRRARTGIEVAHIDLNKTSLAALRPLLGIENEMRLFVVEDYIPFSDFSRSSHAGC